MSKQLKWILVVLIVLILIAGGFFGWWYWQKKKNQKSTASQPATTSSQNDTSSSDNNANGEQAQNGAGWKIFKNFAYGYLIEYPDGATVENGSASEGEKDKPANQAHCVKISTKYVWVVIASRDIPDNIFCLRTGMGTEWSNAPDEQVTAAGQEYTAHGMYTSSASAGYYKDDYLVETLSGERIEYGIEVNEKYDTAMTQAQAKDLVHKIVASFSPAE